MYFCELHIPLEPYENLAQGVQMNPRKSPVSITIFSSLLCTYFLLLFGRICFNFKTCYLWRSFLVFSPPVYLIKQWSSEVKLDAHHCRGLDKEMTVEAFLGQ